MEHPLPTYLDTALAALVSYEAFGAAIARLRADPWWISWPAFMSGAVLCIVMRGWPVARGMSFLIDVLLGHIFLAGAIASAMSFLLVSRYVRYRATTAPESRMP